MKKVLVTCHMGRHYRKFGHYDIITLLKLGCEVHFAANFNQELDKVIDDRIYLHQVDFSRNPFSLKNIKAFKQVKKIINDNKYDLIHCQSPVGGVLTRLAAKKSRKKGTKVIYTAHGFHFYKGASILNWVLFYPIEKWLSKHTDTIITINKEDYYLAKNKFKKTNIEYIPGIGIEPQKFDIDCSENEKSELKKELGIQKSDFVMVSIGELNDNKNHIMQIEAMKILVKKCKNIKLLIAGEGERKKFLEDKIKEYNLVDNIKLLGFRKDIPKILKISHLVLSTSKREGLPVNIVEALFVGLPVIGTDCRGTRDLIQDGINGYIVKIGDVENLCKSILMAMKKSFTFVNNKHDYTICSIREKLKEIFLRKKRILHILASNKYSGAENVVCTMIECFKDEIDMAYCSPIGEIKEIIEDKKIAYYGLKKFNINEIKKTIEIYNPDIIYAHDFKASILAGAINFNGKVISHLHKNDPAMKRISIKSIIYYIISKKFYKIVGVSKSILNEYIFKNGIKDKFNIFYNFVDSDEINKKAKEIRLKKKYNICYVGRLSSEKNPLIFIEIVKELNKNKKTTAVLVGDGILKEECIKKIEEYQLQKVVDLVGFQKNPYPYILNSDICIMPSKFEGFGLVAIESMVLNKPVFNSGVGGLKEIFQNDNYYICNNINEYVKKTIKQFKKNEDFSHLTNKFTDKNTWKNKLRDIFE